MYLMLQYQIVELFIPFEAVYRVYSLHANCCRLLVVKFGYFVALLTGEDERQSNRYNRHKPRNATSPYRYTSPLPKIKSERGSQKTVNNVPHFDQNGDVDGENRLHDSWNGGPGRSPRHSPPRHHSPLTSRRSPPPPQNNHPSQSDDFPVTSRLNESPTNSGDKQGTHQAGTSKYDPRSATYTNQTNDSGIAGLTPEDYDDAER